MLTRDVPKLKFVAETEQNEALGRRLNTEHGFSHFPPMYFASFFHHCIIAQPNYAFYCFALRFKEKKNIYYKTTI